MSTTKKNIVFDVIGTCVSFGAFYAAIDSRLGSKLYAEGIKPQILGFAWIEAAERGYTYLSISGGYVRFFDLFRPLFFRMLWQAGIQEPRKFATEGDAAFIVESYKGLEARPGLDECFSKLRDARSTIRALTTGDTERVRGYFERAGVLLPAENLMSCDTLGVGKPEPGAYKLVVEKFRDCETPRFAAAHTWDASAAKRNGFKAAWCSVWEKEQREEVFGKMDVVADSLPGMAEKIIAASE